MVEGERGSAHGKEPRKRDAGNAEQKQDVLIERGEDTRGKNETSDGIHKTAQGTQTDEPCSNLRDGKEPRGNRRRGDRAPDVVEIHGAADADHPS